MKHSIHPTVQFVPKSLILQNGASEASHFQYLNFRTKKLIFLPFLARRFKYLKDYRNRNNCENSNETFSVTYKHCVLLILGG